MTAIRLMTLFAVGGILVDCAELLRSSRLYVSGGMFSWEVSRTAYQWRRNHSFHVLDQFLRRVSFSSLVVIETVLCAMALSLNSRQSGYCLIGVLAIRVLSSIRNGTGGSEGADHMLLIVLGSIALFDLSPFNLARHAVLWFVAGQCLLSYVTAGTVKAMHAEWRAGRAITAILSTELFGHRGFAAQFRSAPSLAFVVCWAVIAFECGSPLYALASPASCIIFLTCGLLFHVSVAVTQGLNLFVWVFLATYPAVFITSCDIWRISRG